jgi:hypothetical protein
MAKKYLEKLTQLIVDLEIEDETDAELEIRHFFSGAALYANKVICASWTPAGLAFKLPQAEVTRLIASEEAKPLRYFAKGNIKKGYVMFENPEQENVGVWRKYLVNAIGYTA